MTITSQSVDRIRAEQARSLFRNCPLGVISAAVVAAMLAAALATTGRLDVTRAVVWSGMIAGCALAHIGLCVLFWRARPADRAWRKWLFWFTAVAALEGASWFVGAVWMASPHDFSQELIVLLVASAVASGGVPVFGTYQPAFLAFMIPTILVHVGIALYYPYPLHFLLAALEGAYLILMPLVARGFGGQFVDGLRLRFENMDLVEDLRLQKTLAEQANLAKSSFLAAASHDLRQPVHALGLFIGALRARAMDEEARRLVDHIDGSVTAMDDLFASLLDISKLDAGVVEPRLEPVAVGLLLRRLCDDHAEEAAAKGLVMRVVAGHAWVWSDPVLLERILRNVVANALCYTDAGRVLIGCRRAPGSVTVEVWDTGRGIARDQRDLIFQEFYQVGNPERDRSKGLGRSRAHRGVLR